MRGGSDKDQGLNEELMEAGASEGVQDRDDVLN